MAEQQKRIGPLETPIDCRRELARVYRESRRGQISTADAGRFANILQTLVSMSRDIDLEARIKALEETSGH